MHKNLIRKYYKASVYVLDCTIKDENDINTEIEDKFKLLGTFMVSPNRNNGFVEALTGERIGSLDKDLISFGRWYDGFDYPNIYVDVNSLKEASKEEKEEYKKQNKLELSLFFQRTTILNGAIPLGKKYFKTKIRCKKNNEELNEDNFEKETEDIGTYITVHSQGDPFVEVLSGKSFGSFYHRLSHNHLGYPFIEFIIDKYVGDYKRILVDKDNRNLISNTELLDTFREYCLLLDGNELKEFFDKKEKGIEINLTSKKGTKVKKPDKKE